MKIHEPLAILRGAAAGLLLVLSASAAGAQCQGNNCGREEHQQPARPARPAPPQNRPAVPPEGQRPRAEPPPGYRPGGTAPQEGFRSNPGAQQGYRPSGNAGENPVRSGYGAYARPGGPAGAPGHNATRRFTYQGRSFAAVRAAPYRYPRGYGYRAYHPHERFPLALLVAPYFIVDFGLYDLPQPGPDLEWVRYGPDALLVNVDTGEVVDVAYGVFQEDPSYASDYGPGDDGAPSYPSSDGGDPPPDGAYPPPNAPYGYPPPGGPQD